MQNAFDKNYNLISLLRFSLPNIVMMVFLSLYTIVDGIFIARFAGTTALSALNMVFPVICFEMSIGIMFSTGGSAIVARKLGEGRRDEAKADFTFLVAVMLAISFAFMLFGNLFLNQLVKMLGASEAQFQMCKTYAGILLYFAPLYFLQTGFQMFFVTAGKPTLGLAVTVAGGVANMVLDYVFIAILKMGIGGAALATGIGYCVPALTGLLYFSFCRKGNLCFVRPRCNGRTLLHTCANGSSEFVSNLANAVTTYLFNLAFLKYYGEDGVAAITIILYFQFLFSAFYMGYAMGVAPVTSYKYGAGDSEQLKKIFKISVIFLAVSSLAIFGLTQLVAKPVVKIFAGEGNVYEIAIGGFRKFAVCFLFMGLNVFASSLFTSFSDGKTSAVISFARTLVFLAGAILLMPLIFGAEGLWWTIPAAEFLALIVSVFYFIRKKKVYGY